MTQSYLSDNKSLSFIERMQLASEERKVLQKEYETRKKAEALDILETVEQFVKRVCDHEELTNKFIESIHKSASRRKMVELYTFNTRSDLGDIYNKDIKSATIKDKTYNTKYLLSEAYMKLTKKYFPERSKPIKELIWDMLNTETFNNGVDLETKNTLIPCIFVNKHKASVFKNGIYISRDGVDYNNTK